MKHKTKILLFISAFVLMLSCNEQKENKTTTTGNKETTKVEKLSDFKVKSEAPFLFKNNKQIILTWTQWDKNKTNNELKFSFFNPKTKKFNKIQTVFPAKGLQMHVESMAKIGSNKQGVLYAVYRRKAKNTKSQFGGYLYYTISKDMGETWSEEQKLVKDTSSTSQSFFDLALLSDGELGLIWLDSRKPIAKKERGKTIYFAKTTEDKGFTSEKAIIGSTCECCRTELYIDANKTIHVAYRNLIEKGEFEFDGNGDTEIRDMYYSTSTDNGKTFSEPIAISEDNWHINGCPHTGPSLAKNKAKLAAVWFTNANDFAGIFYTEKAKDGFNTRKLISNKGKHPQMIALNNTFYIVYEEYYEKEEKGYTKIVFEKINNKNNIKTEISKTLSNNNHAVLTNIDNQALVVWVNADTRNPKIVYKLLH
jgi:hypothetical protein